MRRNEGDELKAGRMTSAAFFASQALYDRDQARHFGALHRKYEEALRRPGMAIDPDPIAPWLYPRDYLAKVPYYIPDRGTDERPNDPRSSP